LGLLLLALEPARCSRARREVRPIPKNPITRNQARAITVWLAVVTAAVALLQALTQLAEVMQNLLARH
jgi:4-hydroxybenzoate polyprenyltransferase